MSQNICKLFSNLLPKLSFHSFFSSNFLVHFTYLLTFRHSDDVLEEKKVKNKTPSSHHQKFQNNIVLTFFFLPHFNPFLNFTTIENMMMLKGILLGD